METNQQSLYDRLGGTKGIEAIVDQIVNCICPIQL